MENKSILAQLLADQPERTAPGSYLDPAMWGRLNLDSPVTHGLAGALRGLYGMVDFPRQYMQGGIDREAAAKWAPDMALNLLGGGAPFAQKGAAGIFGGKLAATADQAKLAQAEKLAAEGADKYKIWNETGWFQGADGKWRFEIDDSTMRYKREPTTPHHRNARGDLQVGDFMDHPDLFKAYPDLATAHYSTQPGGGGVGSYDPKTGALAVTQYPPGDLSRKQIALHELQHGVQHREGFASGSNPGRAADEFYGPINERLSSLSKALATTDIDDPQRNMLRAAYDALMDQKLSITPEQLYRRAPGEVEARNVEKRRNLGIDERRVMPPWTTE